MKKSLYVLLCAAALVSCGQPKQQQKAVADVVTSGNPIFEGWYADPEGIIYGEDRKSRLNSSHYQQSRMPSSA